MRSFLISAWRAGIRSRAVQAVLVLGVVLVSVAFLAASFSPRQPRTVALDVGLSGLRLTLVLFALYWVQELVGNEIQRRTVLFSLAYPTPRGAYVVGRYLGIVGLLGLAAGLLGFLLWAVVLQAGAGYDQSFAISGGLPYWATIIGLWLDATVVAAFGLWVATVSTVSILPLALGLAFAAGGKGLGAALDYLMRGADGDENVLSLAPLLDTLQWVVPDLSRLDWRMWPMYGAAPEATAVMAATFMAIGYVGVLLAMAVVSFGRREFQ